MNSKTPWTPGPWQPDFDPEIQDGITSSVFTCGETQSEIAGRIGEPANARLIAAAPSLVNALRHLADSACTIEAKHHAGNPVHPEQWSELYADINNACALLAKLEGGQP